MPQSKKQGRSTPSKIRIIAGEWRGRKLVVPDELGLRPTGDRLRETLFNWLAPVIQGARCLDAFAGTGALGLEALSRGAAEVQFIESNPRTASVLRNNLSQLKTDQGLVTCTDCLAWLENPMTAPFDIIFLDPPFAGQLWQATVDKIAQGKFVSDQGLIYIETPKNQTVSPPANWSLHKQKVAGEVCASLYETT